MQGPVRWNYKRAKWELYKDTTDRLFSEIDVTKDIESFTTEVTEKILQASAQCIPRGCRNKYKPFWTDEIQAAITNRKS